MLIIDNKFTKPEANLALEKNLCSLGCEIFMLWRNSPSVIVGKFTNIENDVDLEYARSNNIPIIRRNSGGGAVYHDLGNINYTFIMKDDKQFTLEYFSRIIISILKDIGIASTLEFTHNDIKANGLKISGAAQYHHEGTLLHHGTLLFDSDLGIINRVLKRSGQVTNIKPLLYNEMSTQEFIQAIRRKINDSFQE